MSEGAVTFERRDASAGIPDDVLALLEPERRDVWQKCGAFNRPVVWLARENGAVVSAALTSGRPVGAYCKIVDLWPGVRRAGETGLVDAIVDRARVSGHVAVKVESRSVKPGLRASFEAEMVNLNFRRMRQPRQLASGTEQGVEGYVRWLEDWPHDELPYYGQTTEFTCGAVAGMGALAHVGIDLLDGLDTAQMRVVELEIWRSATNFPAIEPLGLAVALTERFRRSETVGSVEVYLSTDEAIMLDLDFTGAEEFRAELQRESLLRAVQLKIPVHRDWISTDKMVALSRAGYGLLILIDETLMSADPAPHWIFAHSTDGRHLLTEDPWIDAELGETWVDAHELPITLTDVDLMARYGTPAYRGVVVTPGVGE